MHLVVVGVCVGDDESMVYICLSHVVSRRGSNGVHDSNNGDRGHLRGNGGVCAVVVMDLWSRSVSLVLYLAVAAAMVSTTVAMSLATVEF